MKKLLKNLGLAEYYDKKLTLHTVLQINKNSVTDGPVQSLSDLPWLFLKRLMMLQRTARSVKCSSSNAAEDSESDDDQDDQSVNPLDILTAVVSLFWQFSSAGNDHENVHVSVCRSSAASKQW